MKKRWMVKRLVLVGLIGGLIVGLGLLSACRGGQLAGYYIEYGMIGGKPSAPRELLTIDCDSLSIQFIRQQPFNLQQPTLPPQSLSIKQCQTIEALVDKAQLCSRQVTNESHNKLVDGNTYTVVCYHTSPTINHQWYGPQSPSIHWHQYTRELIDRHFPQSYRYP